MDKIKNKIKSKNRNKTINKVMQNTPRTKLMFFMSIQKAIEKNKGKLLNPHRRRKIPKKIMKNMTNLIMIRGLKIYKRILRIMKMTNKFYFKSNKNQKKRKRRNLNQ